MILERLRNETRQHHEQIERSLDLLRPDITSRDVRDLLIRFYGFYEPWEPRVAAVLSPDLHSFFAVRRKVDVLQNDLRVHLGAAANLADLPRCDSLPDLTSEPRALGSIYVLEGSTLGAQIMARHFQSVPGLEGGRGCSFFGTPGSEIGRKWREFQVVLTSRSSPEADEAMVAAACETFVLLHHWLHDAVCPAHGQD